MLVVLYWYCMYTFTIALRHSKNNYVRVVYHHMHQIVHSFRRWVVRSLETEKYLSIHAYVGTLSSSQEEAEVLVLINTHIKNSLSQEEMIETAFSPFQIWIEHPKVQVKRQSHCIHKCNCQYPNDWMVVHKRKVCSLSAAAPCGQCRWGSGGGVSRFWGNKFLLVLLDSIFVQEWIYFYSQIPCLHDV